MPGRVWEQAIDVAADQHGFITFADLMRLGAEPALLRQWYRRGRVRRVGHGIYRFDQIPTTQMDPFQLAVLWPSGRGVLSHDTALELHELCDVNPAAIHLALPPGYRPRRAGGEQYIVHYQLLGDDDITLVDGIRIVTAAMAIKQAMQGHTPAHLIRQAIDTAGRLGLIATHVLRELAAEDLQRQGDKA